MAGNKVPVILDTDIGSDIDDAVCLAYLLKQKQCDLLGITTVSGEPQKRAALADAVCRAAGRKNVPIHSGCTTAIYGKVMQPECPQASVLSRFEHRAPEEFKPNTAVEFLREQIRSRPGEITLLAIGPMTNIGLLFSVDPEIPSLLKELVLMCGIFTHRLNGMGPSGREWNALNDPLSTAITYRGAVKKHVSIGLEVTCKCTMPSTDCIEKFKQIGGPLSVVSAATEVWSKHGHRVTFHDPLAAAAIFKPDVCEWADGKVDVDVKSELVPGMTLFNDKAAEKPHRIAVDVNPELFFNHYFEVTSGK
jgi:purine nucleosidase